jgi:hypothetical protein
MSFGGGASYYVATGVCPSMQGCYFENGTYNGFPQYTMNNGESSYNIWYEPMFNVWIVTVSHELGTFCDYYSTLDTIPPIGLWSYGNVTVSEICP